MVNAAQAEKACVDIGGHLASFPSLLEQAEAEQVGQGAKRGRCCHLWHTHVLCRNPFFAADPLPPLLLLQHYIGLKALLPVFHKGYWLGLSATGWPEFSWGDQSAGPLLYEHWGTFISLHSNSREPNEPLAQCAVANYSQEYENAWGWADTSCTNNFPVMCRCAGTRGAHFKHCSSRPGCCQVWPSASPSTSCHSFKPPPPPAPRNPC